MHTQAFGGAGAITPELAAAKRGHHPFFFFWSERKGVRPHPPNPLGYVPGPKEWHFSWKVNIRMGVQNVTFRFPGSLFFQSTVSLLFLWFKQLGLQEPWFVITHTIWTTQEDTVFISDSDRNGGRCSVFRSDILRDSLIVSECQKEWDDEDEGVPRNVWSKNWTSTIVLVTIANKNCVLLRRSNRVCYHESGRFL